MTRRESAITERAISVFASLRNLHETDPAAAERIRKTIETELIALTQPTSLTDRANTED